MPTKTTELTVLDEFKILEVYRYDVIERAAEAIETEVMSEVCDVKTHKGREREKALAYKVSQAKQKVIKMANASIEEARATVKGVTGERLRMEDRFDGIRDKRKAGTLEWERAYTARVMEREKALSTIKGFGTFIGDLDSKSLAEMLEELGKFDVSGMEEFMPEAEIAKTESIAILETALTAAKDREEKDAELKRLQEEAEKRKVEDAKRKAASDKFVQDELDKVIADQKFHDDKIAAEELAEQRKADLKQAKEEAKLEERNRLAEIAKDFADIAKENADRAESARLAEENAELKRKADKDHRAKVLTEIGKALRLECVDQELSEDDGELIAWVLSEGKIPHVTINF